MVTMVTKFIPVCKYYYTAGLKFVKLLVNAFRPFRRKYHGVRSEAIYNKGMHYSLVNDIIMLGGGSYRSHAGSCMQVHGNRHVTCTLFRVAPTLERVPTPYFWPNFPVYWSKFILINAHPRASLMYVVHL